MADTDNTPTEPTEEIVTGSEEDSLEGSSTIVESSDSNDDADSLSRAGGSSTSPASPPSEPTGPKAKWWRRLLGRFNIYLLFFLLLLLAAGTILIITYFSGKHDSGTARIASQTLTQNALNQLANSDVNVGSSSQVLNVQSSAVFAGKVLIRQDLDIAGNLRIGGTLASNDLTVAGTAQIGQLQVNKNLSVAGNTAVQGAVTIAKSLQVNGGGNFNGSLSATQITASALQLNGDLVLTHHVTAGGPAPGRTNGPALGNGGSTSVSGSDSGGSVAINTGGNPAAGCLVTISFTSKYPNTPHVLVTPVGLGAGGLGYYINRSSSSFSICTASPAPAGSSFGFDYFVVG